jgi:DNA-binding transcriptional regulator YdaS (Cro superfamily)
MTQTILQKVVAGEPFNGNQSAFAKATGTSQQNVSNWLRKGSVLPAEFVLAAEAATGVPRHEWRPDIYPAPSQADAA